MKLVHRAALPIVVAPLATLALAAPPTAAAPPPPPPSLRLTAPNTHVQAEVWVMPDGKTLTSVWPGLSLEARGSRFEAQISRPTYDRPLEGRALVAGRWKAIPATLLKTWRGFADGIEITWRDAAGSTLSHATSPLCPTDGPASRVDPNGPTDDGYQVPCRSHPFTRGMVWGVEQGWAGSILGTVTTGMKLRDGQHYALQLTVRRELADFLGISTADRSITLDVRAKVFHAGAPPTSLAPPASRTRSGGPGDPASAAASRRAGDPMPATPGAATAPNAIPADTLPDLAPLPALGIRTRYEGASDLIDFAATVFDASGGPLVVEGFRRPGTTVMDAHQYFFRDGKVVGHVPAGTMEYDARPSHEHWHFKDFASYDLIDGGGRRVVASGKEAFSLAPTDPIDLLARGAVRQPGNGDLATACGGASSIWVRERLPAGWGDTYLQSRAGQSLDVTGVPNGTYRIRVTANPQGRLHESDTTNDVSLRTVVLGGAPGARTVRVPPYQGIDTEAPGAWGSDVVVWDGGHPDPHPHLPLAPGAPAPVPAPAPAAARARRR
ncbi:MAG: hypothetical protein JWM05_3586 [Acidimicrobiales bacterium]|nr:hypothetical protein [Acidimicrobiales bacterium]